MLQEPAEKRYSHLIHSNPGILQNAPLKTIASYLEYYYSAFGCACSEYGGEKGDYPILTYLSFQKAAATPPFPAIIAQFANVIPVNR